MFYGATTVLFTVHSFQLREASIPDTAVQLFVQFENIRVGPSDDPGLSSTDDLLSHTKISIQPHHKVNPFGFFVHKT